MEMGYIKTKIQEVQSKYPSLSDDRAFNFVTLKAFYLPEASYSEIEDSITDAANDGGIDFVFYDDEQQKVFVAQCKYSSTLECNSIISELNKMSDTVSAFVKGATGSYNSALKRELQNAIDRLPENDAGNVEYVIFTAAKVNVDAVYDKIDRGEYAYSKEMVSIYQQQDISSKIEEVLSTVKTVHMEKVFIDRANNYLSYESDSKEGIIVNLKSTSLIALYNKYQEKGLFDLNIRKYIRNKMVDRGIQQTLSEERDEFWFYNNGIIIACDEFDVDGNCVRLYDFSIVNGGQTTTLIGKYRGGNTQEFVLPCKIVCQKKTEKADSDFFNKIAEATNSQKPILSRDLKSNSPEMRQLQALLLKEKVFLEIKRGDTVGRKGTDCKIRNDELGQLILSFAFQRPGTARSGKKTIFENYSLYNKIFKNNYGKDLNKKNFLIDLVDLNSRYTEIEKALMQDKYLDSQEKIILKNGKQVIFSLFGILYALVNSDYKGEELLSNSKIVQDLPFVYSGFISNYSADDLNKKLREITIGIVQILSELYEKSMDKVTSVSNYFKTDTRYIDDILKGFAKEYCRYSRGEDIRKKSNIFLRA